MYSIKAFHIGQTIDLSAILGKTKFEILKDEVSFILLKKSDDQYLYVKNYGSLAFCNFSESDIEKFFHRYFSKSLDIFSLAQEEYDWRIENCERPSVSFNTVASNTFSLDMLHIIMFNLCQSVVLENYQMRTNDLLEKTREFSDNLSKTGDIGLNRIKLRKFFGRTMVLKNRIAENLLIFETSDLAWSEEELSDADSALREQLDMVNRHQGLQHSLSIVKENLDLFRDILQHKHSSTLEWIIILLILLEVADLLIAKLLS